MHCWVILHASKNLLYFIIASLKSAIFIHFTLFSVPHTFISNSNGKYIVILVYWVYLGCNIIWYMFYVLHCDDFLKGTDTMKGLMRLKMRWTLPRVVFANVCTQLLFCLVLITTVYYCSTCLYNPQFVAWFFLKDNKKQIPS